MDNKFTSDPEYAATTGALIDVVEQLTLIQEARIDFEQNAYERMKELMRMIEDQGIEIKGE